MPNKKSNIVKVYGQDKFMSVMPNLLEIQLKEYKKFLQLDFDPNSKKKRKNIGLESVFRSVFPIEGGNDNNLILEYSHYILSPPIYSEEQAKDCDLFYSAHLKAVLQLINKENGEIREQEVFMGDIPLMTSEGKFIINGADRVVVSQIQRSPGIFFFFDKKLENYETRIIPEKGSWLELTYEKKGIITLRIDRKKKLNLGILLKALGYESPESIFALFYDIEHIKAGAKTSSSKNKFIKTIVGRYSAKTIADALGEVLVKAGEKINTDIADSLVNSDIFEIDLLKLDEYNNNIAIISTMEKCEDVSAEEAVMMINSVVRPGETRISPERAKDNFQRLFFDSRRYDLGIVGRYMINRKFKYDAEKHTYKYDKEGFFNPTINKKRAESSILLNEDIIDAIKYLLHLIEGNEILDDIDNLGNRRIRTVGELLTNQMKMAFAKMERSVREKMNLEDPNDLNPQTLISIKPITTTINEFFGTSQLSQFMDQTNPIAELTHKRRLNALGPGGLTRERAGFEVRDVHFSHYGRMCPIETPEGPNIGLIVSLSSYARVNDYGFIETPYRKVVNGYVTDEIEYLTADQEINHYIAQADIRIDSKGKLLDEYVPCRYNSDFPLVQPKLVTYMDISPKQIISVSTALIPFVEHDDANRALMGSNMQRQGVPLMISEAPFISTGMEEKVAYDSGVLVIAKEAGVVSKVDAANIYITKKNGEIDHYKLKKYKMTNQNTCFNQVPIVSKGQKVSKGEVLADGPATDKGTLALGKNLLVAFMPWEGYNYEDAILINENVLKEDKLTSIHVSKFETTARETKLGPETITRDIPNLSDEALRNLDENGYVRIGAKVKQDDILIGKITPKGETDLTPEYKLLHSIFGEKAKEVRDTSLRVPHGTHGTVIDVKSFTREDGEVLKPGINELGKVYIAKISKLSEGDKLAGRHGNKGVISKILPQEDMPFLKDGTPVDIVLNPLGVPSRMNIGQILETELGWAAKKLEGRIICHVFESPSVEDIENDLESTGLPRNSKFTLYDGKTGKAFKNQVLVGYIYMMKLNHLVEDKIHARSTGPYSLVTQQPLGGKAQFGGQRLGEMEVWAIEAYGASNLLQELLTVKSDDMLGRSKIYESIVKNTAFQDPGVPESFNVLVREMRGLALDLNVLNEDGDIIELKSSDDFTANDRKIKFATYNNR